MCWIAAVASGQGTVVSLDADVKHQEIEGFGVSLTDSSAWLLHYGLTDAARSNLLIRLFCPTNGAGLNFLRQPIGSSDFRLQDYTYNDMPAGQTDYGLNHFSIEYDETYIIPLLRQIAALNPNLKIMGSPWSPPAWMKDSGHLYSGRLENHAYDVYAAYLRRYIQAYAAHGLPIHFLTLQNEPLYEPTTYAGCYMDESNQIELVKRVGRDFSTNDITTKILVYDHNWDQYSYPIAVLNDTGAAAFAAGSAFHGYEGDVSFQTLVHQAHPDKEIHFTECSGGAWSGDFAYSLMWDAQTLIIGALRHWSKSVIKWNLALDADGGPKLEGGCEDCRGLVTIHTGDAGIVTNSEYYALAHASRFLQPGARRIEAVETAAGGPYTVAFVNPDESMVAIACNPDPSSRDFTFRWDDQSFSHAIPAQSMATFTWPNEPEAAVDMWLTTGDQASLLEKQAVALSFFLSPAEPDPNGAGEGMPIARKTALFDNFNDTTTSNIWMKSGDFGGAEYQETNGCFRIRPGTNWAWQSSGYVPVAPIPWNNTSAWHVFSAVLSTIQVDVVSGGDDITTLLGICGEPDNPWWASNSIGLYGYYNAELDWIRVKLRSKTDARAYEGDPRFEGAIVHASKYLNGTNAIRIGIALGRNLYDIRFSDRSGLPIPVITHTGAPRAAHNMGDKITNAYWYVGAENDDLKRGSVCWDETAVYSTYPPAGVIRSAAQTSVDGSGIVTISNEVWDMNGDFCRLGLEASTNGGASWFAIRAASITSSLPAQSAPTSSALHVFSIQTTNSAGFLESNRVVITWDTKDAGMNGHTVPQVRLRLRVDDGDVGFGPVHSEEFVLDNEAPSAADAIVTIEGGAEWTINAAPQADWSGFSDAGSAIAGYYYALQDRSGTSDGTFTADAGGTMSETEADATNTLYVWAMDVYGNIGGTASDRILVLREEGDFDGDGYSNTEEFIIGTDPRDPACRMAFGGEAGLLDGERLVRWTSVMDRLYSVYFTDRLGDEWQPVSGCADLPGTGDVMFCPVPPESFTSRFYRIGIRLP